MRTKRERRRIKEFLSTFNLAGFTYYDGPEAIKNLEVGNLLELELEEDNRYDPKAVMLWYGDFHLGYIPKASNEIFYKLLRVGIPNIEVRIQQIDTNAHPEQQIQLVAHLVAIEKE
ncbi:MAG TPA: HIRAN domain-containing protein [Edaphocola sp.]|nr:HIRAN domain-containing protein [Edaphocola sp.]